MANMRIHELAKQINVSNKEIIGILKNNNRDNLTHMSNVSDSEVTVIKKALRNTDDKISATAEKTEKKMMDKPIEKKVQTNKPQDVVKSEKPVTATTKSSTDVTEGKTEEVKKSHITQVYNPQNSSRGRDNQGQQGGYRRNNTPGQGQQGSYNRDNRENRNYGNQGQQGGYRDNRNNTNAPQGTQGGYRGNNYGQNQGNQSNYRDRNNSEQGYNRNNSEQGYNNRNNSEQGYNRNNSEQGYRGNNYNSNQNNQGNYRQNNYAGQGQQGGYNRDNKNFAGQQSQGGYRDNKNYSGQQNQGGYRDNRGYAGQGTQGGGYRSNYQGQNQGTQNGNNRGYAGQGGQGGQGTQGGQGGYNRSFNDRGNQGTFNRDGNSGGQGGYRGNNNQGGYRGNNNSQGGFRGNNSQGGYKNNQNGSRTEVKHETTSDEFILQTKPESRRADYKRNDKVEKKTQKDTDTKENLKFVNNGKKTFTTQKPAEKEEVIKTLILPDILTIKELAEKMKVVPSVVVKKLFLQGKVVTINQEIDYDTAEEIALEFNCICDHEVKVDVIAELLKEDDENEDTLVARPPVVCVMGHVDHGKTSLLDTIRSTRVTAKEAGGITQHIGAYTVEINDQKITFLDTPGHEAFTAMRMRGAQATDIAILVVAADDGVMPQTIEAINHAKAAGIDIIVAINKIDKPNANIERVKQELTEYELISEDWGGDTIFVPVSAHTKEGIDTLLEMILLTAEMRELKANPNRNARGIVIEAQLDKGKGPVASILVQKGTLRVGDNVAAGSCYGKIRAMTDDKGRKVKEAGPSTPVEVLGLNDVPNAGEIIVITENEKEARNFAETFIREGREKLLDDTKAKLSLDDLFTQIQAGNVKELGIIIKADVQGSVEAIKQSLIKLSNEEVAVKIIHGGVGNINESDVILASASNAIIIGFNVKPDNQARLVADREKVDLRLYKVIYNAIEDVTAALKGMLEPTYEEKVIGHAQIRQIFKASGIGNIAGAYVTDGKINKNSKVRITRDGENIFDGPLASLKRFKDEVKEVKEGYECGLVFEKFNEIKEEDIVEAYEMVEVPR